MRPPRRPIRLQVDSSDFLVRLLIIGWRGALLRVTSRAPSWPSSVIVRFQSIVLHYVNVCLFKLTSPLRPSQVNNIQKALTRIRFVVECLYFDLKHVMTAARCFVHAIEFENPLLLRHHYNIHKWLRVVNWHPDLAWAEYFTSIAFDFKILVFRSWQKIPDILTVNLQRGHLKFDLFSVT